MATKKTTTKKTTRKPATAKKAASKRAVTKKTTTTKTSPPPEAKKLSAIEAAAKVLAKSKEPLNAKTMIERMASQGYWKSPGGKTPSATLYAAILREIKAKGNDSRFRKMDRGLFALNK